MLFSADGCSCEASLPPPRCQRFRTSAPIRRPAHQSRVPDVCASPAAPGPASPPLLLLLLRFSPPARSFGGPAAYRSRPCGLRTHAAPAGGSLLVGCCTSSRSNPASGPLILEPWQRIEPWQRTRIAASIFRDPILLVLRMMHSSPVSTLYHRNGPFFTASMFQSMFQRPMLEPNDRE